MKPWRGRAQPERSSLASGAGGFDRSATPQNASQKVATEASAEREWTDECRGIEGSVVWQHRVWP